ncbi:MAG: phosphohistidine phosphatase SixA [Rhodospirillales bacterium]|jgi:phosphohistidine phosphatase|nr:phosphohistidine phosphatase SixA [Rhodospirillales bacterium]
MRLIMVQHGEAVPEEQDPERPLTPLGRSDIERLSAFLAEGGIAVPRIVHSGKLRALDTANALAARMAAKPQIAIVDRISPKDSPVWLTEAVDEWNDDTLLVSHQPFLSRLLSRLVMGSEQPWIFEFTPGSAVCLSRRAASRAWVIDWIVPPALLRR